MNSLSLPDANDDELLAALKAGDAGALDVLLKRYWSPLIAYLTRMSGSPDAAEDIAQRTFHRLWERRTTWRTAGSVRGLLYRIAHNLAVSDYRMERARERADSVGGDSHADAPTPLAAVEDAELREMLDRAIQALPPRRREVFVLRCIHDMPYRDIAEVLGISQQTVANQLSRALTTLRLILRPSELLQVEPEQSGTARQDEQARLRLAVLRYREYEAARQRRGANGSGNGHLEPRLTRRGDGLYGQQRRREGDARQQTSEHRGPSGYRCTGCARRAVRCRSSSRHAARQRFVPCPR